MECKPEIDAVLLKFIVTSAAGGERSWRQISLANACRRPLRCRANEEYDGIRAGRVRAQRHEVHRRVELIELEPRIRDEINTRVSRGRLNVVVAYHLGPAKTSQHVEIDRALARAYVRAARQLGKELKLADGLTVDSLLKQPGVMQVAEAGIDIESVWPGVESALQKALDALVRMREKEGKFLREDLLKRLRACRDRAGRIRGHAPEVVKRHQLQLRERIKSAGVEIPVDDERLIKEVVFFADRSDITEELTRLESHLRQFEGCLNAKEPVGRTLDFLVQEMGREVNTIGSKANDATISQLVVESKAELEKIREQVQNIE
jgi:uncharacterized protein (TIGR00255 family)